MSFGRETALMDNGLQSIANSIPCVVTAFVQDGENEPFVNVIPSIRRKVFNGRDVEYEDHEEIEEVRIGYISTQSFALTIPIKEGDRGILISSDFNLDLWDKLGEAISDSGNANFKEFGDSCYFLPMIYPEPKGIAEYKQDAMVMRTIDNLGYVKIKEDGEIEIGSNVAVKINAPSIILNGQALGTINAGSGPTSFATVVAPAFPEDPTTNVNRP